MKKFTPASLTLTVYNRAATEYGVCFMTEKILPCTVEFTLEEDKKFARATAVSVKHTECDGRQRNTAVLGGLEKNKKYLWRISDGSGYSDTFKFCTSEEENLAFAVFSDSQDRQNFGKWWKTAWSDAVKRFPDMKLCLHGGDVVENGTKPVLWDRVTKHNRGLFTSFPMLAVTGNHDFMVHTGDVMHKYFNVCPPNDKEEEIFYYSVDVGPVHFTMLCSGDYNYTERHGLKEEQIEWAKRDIASTDKKWKVVVIHTPFYSPGKYGSLPDNASQPTSLRHQFNEVFANLGVDMVFTGHDHIFSETYPIMSDGKADHAASYIIKKVDDKYYRLAVEPKGPIHIESGCVGNQNRAIECGDEMDEESAGYFRDIVETPVGCVGYVGVRISDDVLTADYVLKRVSDGEDVIVRRFGIKK